MAVTRMVCIVQKGGVTSPEEKAAANYISDTDMGCRVKYINGSFLDDDLGKVDSDNPINTCTGMFNFTGRGDIDEKFKDKLVVVGKEKVEEQPARKELADVFVDAPKSFGAEVKVPAKEPSKPTTKTVAKEK